MVDLLIRRFGDMVELLEAELDRLQKKRPSTIFSSDEYLELLRARVEVSSIHGHSVDSLKESSVGRYAGELMVLADEKREMLEQREIALFRRASAPPNWRPLELATRSARQCPSIL